MRYILIFIFISAVLSAKAQFPGTDSLRNYNNRYITTNPATAFTNNRLNTLLRGIIDFIDTARASAGGGAIALGIDTVFAVNDSTIRYRKNGVFRQFILKGVYDSRRKVDTIYKSNDTTLTFTVNGNLRTVIIPGGTNLNLATANQTATGNRTHNWDNHWLYLNNIKAFGIYQDQPDANHVNNNFKTQITTDSSVDGTPLQLMWGLRNIDGDIIDSVHFELTSKDSATYLHHWGADTAKSVKLSLNGNAPTTDIRMDVASSSKVSAYKFGHVTSIEPADSIRLKLQSTSATTKIIGARAESSGIWTPVVIDIPTSGVTALNNIGTGYNLVATPGGNIKRLNNGYGVLIDSATSNTNTIQADTSSTNHVVTQSDLNDAIAGAGGGATAGIQTSVTGTAVNYDPRVNSNLIFNDFLLTSIGPKWDASNAPNTTITFSNGHMRLAGGNSTDYIYDSTTTITHRWTEEIRAVIQSVGGSDYFSFGVQSQGIQSILVKIKASDLSSTITYDNGSSTLGTTPAQGTTVVGDSVIYRIRRDNYTFYFDVINVTQSTSETLTYNYTDVDAVSSIVYPFRVFTITLNPVAGTIDIDYVKLYNQERLNADWLVVGHSIAEGFNAGPPDSTYYNRLQTYFPDKRFGMYAISGGQAVHFTNDGTLKSDMLALRPKRALIMLGINEIQAGTTTSAFVNNMRALVDTIENHGTQVIVCNTTPYNGANKAAIIAYNSALLTEFGTQLINIYDTLEVDGLMQSSNDSLHPDAQGHRYLFNVLKDEITRLANIPYDPEGIIRIFPRGIESGRSMKGIQSNFGIIPLNLGNSGTLSPGVGYNIKFLTTSAYNYLASDYANLIQLGDAGKMRFRVAASGTAGDPITFTDAMTITPAGDIGNGEITPLAPYHIKRNQSGKTTLGEASMLILDNSSGGTGQRQEIGMGYRNANAYSPVVLGNVVTSNTDFTISDFYIATRALTTNTTPIERFRIGADGKVKIHTADIGSASDSAWTWNRSTNALEYSKINSGGATIYSADGTLAGDRTVSTGGFTTTWSGSNDNETSFSVTNTGTTSASAIAGTASGTTSVGVTGTSTSYIGVFGNSTSNTGVQGQSSSGVGVIGVSASGAGLRGQNNPSSNNAVENVLTLGRTSSSGAGANGIGSAIQYELETATNGNSQTAGSLAFQWTDATAATRTSQFEIYGVNSGTTARKAAVSGSGQWTWDTYGSGTHTGTPTGSLQVTSGGGVIEGPALAAGTFTPTLTAVTNTSSPLLDGARYTRIGNIVTFSFRFSVTTSSGSSASTIRVTLPVASSFSNTNQAAGTCSGSLGRVEADAANDELIVAWTSGAGGTETIVVTGQYTIL